MNEANTSPSQPLQEQNQAGETSKNESAENVDSGEQTVEENNGENEKEGLIENEIFASKQSKQESQGEAVKVFIEEEAEEKPLTSPPRKSARLSAKRRDSATDSDISITTKSESPVPRRRSLRRNSTSSQDIPPPPKAKEEPPKLPTIDENDKTDSQAKLLEAENENCNNEKTLVDELAAAFVEEFIDE